MRSSFGNAIQRVIWEVDPAQPIYELSTMDQILARAVFLPRLSTTLLAMFAIAALLLAALGIYGVLSYSVSQRTQRDWPAHGARRIGRKHRRDDRPEQRGDGRDRRRRSGWSPRSLLARSMAGILYGVGPFDVPSFALAALTLLIAGVLASLLPALRTTRVDPVVALREQ